VIASHLIISKQKIIKKYMSLAPPFLKVEIYKFLVFEKMSEIKKKLKCKKVYE
jgi:hypothetical protein